MPMVANNEFFTQVGASFFQTTVSLWMVDLNQIKKDIAAALEASPEKSPFSHGNSLRKSFTKQKPTPEAKKSLVIFQFHYPCVNNSLKWL